MPTLLSKTFNTHDALALAVAVYEAQGQRVEKYSGTAPGNKEIMLKYLGGDHTLMVTDQHRDLANIIVSNFNQRNTLSMLTGKRNSEFFQTIMELFEREQIKVHQVGLMAWAPKLYYDLMSRDDLQERETSICANSKYLTTNVGKSVELMFYSTTNRMYSKQYNLYIYSGHDGTGNHVSFFHKADVPDGSKIRGRVKSYDNRGMIKSTKLHYVKLVSNK
jgi:hypothetical protein